MRMIPRRGFLGLASGFSLVPMSVLRSAMVDMLELRPGAFIYEDDFDHPCEILDVGHALAFRNEGSQWSWGTFDRSTQRIEVSAGGGWGKVGGTVRSGGDVV